MDLPYDLDKIPLPKRAKTLPAFYSFTEIKVLIKNAPNLKHQTILMLIYSSGLRVSEAVNLELTDIFRDQSRIKIRQGKGEKDRYTILSKVCLKYLEKYYKQYRPIKWLFPGRNNGKMSVRSVQHLYYNTLKLANIKRKGGIHTLRHSFATHSLETGMGVFHLQKFLGHKCLKTTLRYVHLRENQIIAQSPLDVYFAKSTDS